MIAGQGSVASKVGPTPPRARTQQLHVPACVRGRSWQAMHASFRQVLHEHMCKALYLPGSHGESKRPRVCLLLSRSCAAID
jgi:hypothetical protein